MKYRNVPRLYYAATRDGMRMALYGAHNGPKDDSPALDILHHSLFGRYLMTAQKSDDSLIEPGYLCLASLTAFLAAGYLVDIDARNNRLDTLNKAGVHFSDYSPAPIEPLNRCLGTKLDIQAVSAARASGLNPMDAAQASLREAYETATTDWASQEIVDRLAAIIIAQYLRDYAAERKLSALCIETWPDTNDFVPLNVSPNIALWAPHGIAPCDKLSDLSSEALDKAKDMLGDQRPHDHLIAAHAAQATMKTLVTKATEKEVTHDAS